jgi:DNA replication protein DnaC
MQTDLDPLQTRAKALHLNGLLMHWQEAIKAGWVPALLDWEEKERARRSLERRLAEAHIGRFKPLSDFDWAWPERCDRAEIEALMSFEFLKEITNVILVAPNGLGKTMIAKNSARATVLKWAVSTILRSTTCSAKRRIVQRARPVGGLEHASAIS